MKPQKSWIHTFGVLITQGPLPHIGKLDGTLRAGVHEPVTADRVEFGRCDYLGEFLHVRRLDVHNVEALVLNVEIPQVHSEVITADKGFAITVNGDAIYMIRVGIGVCSPWNSSNHGIMVCQTRQLQSCRVLEGDTGCTRHTTAPDRARRSELI
jgi:hypothetical protein